MSDEVKTGHKKVKTSFKKNDWVFCEFKLQQIEKVKNGRVVEVGDGHFCTSSWSMNDRCFSLNKTVKCISDTFAFWHDKLFQEGNRDLNFPNIQNWLVEKWCEVCNVKDNKEALRAGISELEDFAKRILSSCEEQRAIEVAGVKVFGRK